MLRGAARRTSCAGLASPLCMGSASTSSAAICCASEDGRRMPGRRSISPVNRSIASCFANVESRPASSQGSRSSWARADIMLKGMPFLSSPTAAKRNLFRSGRNGAYSRRRAIAQSLPLVCQERIAALGRVIRLDTDRSAGCLIAWSSHARIELSVSTRSACFTGISADRMAPLQWAQAKSCCLVLRGASPGRA